MMDDKTTDKTNKIGDFEKEYDDLGSNPSDEQMEAFSEKLRVELDVELERNRTLHEEKSILTLANKNLNKKVDQLLEQHDVVKKEMNK